ncbi:hypothetical protein [Mesorhizobium sp. STM 4661]|uniref:COG3904 family protein n=1 Tax=Mesorhizobium sp. STM 4661 TaxID=1297570 RepID=UPI0002C0178B|nr:hypothetical protein [Mesorhizobium sp. STM 4661]CCV13504.1 conserved exported hypothetical protein [Mesorhizobium sp. STM 4661]
MGPWHRLNGQTWWSLGLICLLSFCFIGDAAFAANTKKSTPDLGPTMRFVVVRSNAPGCEPTCPEWVSAEGSIEAGTPALLRRTLKTLRGRKLPVVVDSPGGNVEAALALGRLIRKNKLDMAVGKTRFTGCQPDAKDCKENDGKNARYFGNPYANGAICNSACPLMFAGGIRRVVGQWAYLGVHQITTTYIRTKLQYRTTYRVVRGKKKIIDKKVISRKNAGSYKTYEMSKALEKKLAAYLKEMNVGQGVLEAMKNTPASGIQQLVPYDMLQTKLVTSLDSLDLLSAPIICKASPVPANCREIPANKGAEPADVPTAEARSDVPQSAEAVQSKEEAEMRFALVRGSNPLCNPDCPEWISAEGTITAGTPDRLRQLLDTLSGRRLPVVISSSGGDVLGALAAGRLIREHKLDVAVARTDFVDCDPGAMGCVAKDGVHAGLDGIHAGLTIDSGGECDSACVIMVAGGVRRLVGPSARLSVQSMGQAQKVEAYLEEMAIDRDLFTAIQRHSVLRQLEPDTMLKFGLTTDTQSVDELTGATICRLVPKPDNCRVTPSADAEAATPPKL